jgi:hypothetical protein
MQLGEQGSPTMLLEDCRAARRLGDLPLQHERS